MFCFHKWGEVVDRRQTCTKCGKTRILECIHKWGEKDLIYIGPVRGDSGKIISWSYREIRLVCANCGEQKKITI